MLRRSLNGTDAGLLGILMRLNNVTIGGIVWLLVAIGIGASGLLANLRPPGPQILIAGLTVTLILAGLFVQPLRLGLATIDLRVVVGLHLTRFVGAYFLFLYGRGELPYEFAVPAGVGDIVVALGALVLISTVRPDRPKGRWLYLGWNVLGTLDILGVVVTAAVQGIADPGSMSALLRLPLNLLPTFLVPLIIASHLLLAVRLLAPTSLIRSTSPQELQPRLMTFLDDFS
jgi:hypothetical protein